MTPGTFTCKNVLCRDFAKSVSLDSTFDCFHEVCLGRKLLLTPPPLPPRPFWKNERFLAALVLLMASAFVLALLIHAAIPKHAVVPPQANETGAPQNDPRFEVQSLVASAESLLRLWRAKLVAHDTAQTKWVSGQRVTSDGRTSEEALDRAKLTYQQERLFADIAQQKDKEILAEVSRYQEIIKRVTAFPPRTIRTVFDSLRQNERFSARGELAVGLAERHAQQHREGQLELKVVYSDYEQAALR